MEEQIRERLREVEAKYGVTILLACETGSRAWGFPSPDSDYDVRFIYLHPHDKYLSLDDPQETIEDLEGDLDLVGWDLRKSLRLLRKSNAAMFERLQSPIVYRQRTDFRERLQELAPAYFSCRAGLHHYSSMAWNYYKACEPETQVKLKSYFYLLRTTLASRWIVEKESIPPLLFQELLPLVEEEEIRSTIDRLLALKTTVDESYRHPKEPELERYLKNTLDHCKALADAFNRHRGETGPLDELFREYLNRNFV